MTSSCHCLFKFSYAPLDTSTFVPSNIKSLHYSGVIMSSMASQITSVTIVYSTIYSGTDQRNIKAPRRWPLCGEFTSDRCRNKQLSILTIETPVNSDRAHYDVNVMISKCTISHVNLQQANMMQTKRQTPQSHTKIECKYIYNLHLFKAHCFHTNRFQVNVICARK